MERHFVLPAVIAAAIHGGLLFGFGKSPRAAAAVEPTIARDFIVRAMELVTPEPVEETDRERGKETIDQPVAPSQPELERVLLASDFTVARPPRIAVDPADLELRVIPPPPGGVGIGGEGAAWSSILGLVHLDATPRTRSQPPPVYPFQAKREGLSGEVVVEFIVDESGSVMNTRVVRSSSAVFEEAALRAVGKWRFEPGRRSGRVVSFKMAVPVVFSLRE